MPTYRYRAISTIGKVVAGMMDDENKGKVLERLRESGLKPISVQEAPFYMKAFSKRKKKNQASTLAVTRYTRDKLIEEQKKRQQKGLKRDISIDLSFLKRATKEDVFAFTQSFYLLKRANFTNIRALTALLENTENPAMRDVVEDILNGVESGEYIYTTMEYYDSLFPDIYISTIRVRRNFWFTYKCLVSSNEIFRGI